jgi:hypothetical protein
MAAGISHSRVIFLGIVAVPEDRLSTGCSCRPGYGYASAEILTRGGERTVASAALGTYILFTIASRYQKLINIPISVDRDAPEVVVPMDLYIFKLRYRK